MSDFLSALYDDSDNYPDAPIPTKRKRTEADLAALKGEDVAPTPLEKFGTEPKPDPPGASGAARIYAQQDTTPPGQSKGQSSTPGSSSTSQVGKGAGPDLYKIPGTDSPEVAAARARLAEVVGSRRITVEGEQNRQGEMHALQGIINGGAGADHTRAQTATTLRGLYSPKFIHQFTGEDPSGTLLNKILYQQPTEDGESFQTQDVGPALQPEHAASAINAQTRAEAQRYGIDARTGQVADTNDARERMNENSVAGGNERARISAGARKAGGPTGGAAGEKTPMGVQILMRAMETARLTGDKTAYAQIAQTLQGMPEYRRLFDANGNPTRGPMPPAATPSAQRPGMQSSHGAPQGGAGKVQVQRVAQPPAGAQNMGTNAKGETLYKGRDGQGYLVGGAGQ
jgi:hypothetical protein